MEKIELTQEIIRELIDYDPETGDCFWKFRDRKWFKSDGVWKSWNSSFSGKKTGSLNIRDGYIQLYILNIKCRLHRIIWLYVYGEWPKNMIDHINRIKSDNRLINLREATNTENGQNREKQKNNTSGYKGVSWNKQAKKWETKIMINSKHKHLGLFENKEDAYIKYNNVRNELHPFYNPIENTA